MAENLVVNGQTYNGVKAIVLTTNEGEQIIYFANPVLSVNGATPDENGNVEILGGSGGSGGLTAAQINALDGLFKIAAYTADASAAYEAFLEAFASSGEEPEVPDEPVDPDVTLTSIAVKYSGGDVEVGTALTDLKGIVVTATYSDGNFKTVTGYTLSGTIKEGVNIITVSYGGLTATFTVTGYVQSVTYTVTNNLTGVTNSNSQTEVTDGFYSATLTVEDGFMLNSVVITMGGVDVTDSVYTAETGSILITEVTGDIVITAVASEPQYVGMRSHLYHDALDLYSSADNTTKLQTKYYISGGAVSLCRTETDVNVIIRLTNNTDSDISDSSYAGCAVEYISKSNYVPAYNAVLGTSATVRAGQTVEYTYTLKAGCYLYVYANNDLEVSVVGVLDIHEPVAEYELTTGYADAWNAYSDGTTDDDDKLGGGYYVTFTTTTEVFEEDTNLRITLVNGGVNMGFIGSAKQNAPTNLFYAVSGMSAPESGGMAVIHYTVKAGHILSMGMNNIGYVFVEKA